MKINNRMRERMNNNAKFDELEFLDKNNDEKDKRDHMLIFH